MTKETMIRNYRKFSAANAYILGFEYKHNIYYIMVDEIPPRYMTVERESSNFDFIKPIRNSYCVKVLHLSAVRKFYLVSITRVLSLKD